MKDLSFKGLGGSSSEDEGSRECGTEAAWLREAMMRTASLAAAAGSDADLTMGFVSGMSAAYTNAALLPK